MKKITLIMMILAVLPFAAFADAAVADAAENYFADYPGARIVPASKAFKAVKNGSAFILDIRKAKDYKKGHLEGSVNAPWGPELAEAIKWLPEDQPIYITCYSGQTAGQATAVLNVAGFEASSIKYGWNAGISKESGYEEYVSKEPVAAPAATNNVSSAVRVAAMDYFNNLKSDPSTPSNIIASAKANKRLESGEDVVVVSVRKAKDFKKGHIEGAINIPFGKNMQEAFDQLPTDKKIFVYCYSGQTAGQVVGIMRLMGYDAASILSGMGTDLTGNKGWATEGFAVVQ